MEKNIFAIKITPKAYEDLDGIYKTAAGGLKRKMEMSINRLKDFPFSCSDVEDETLKAKGYRKLVVENYCVLHLVREDEKQVAIMRVLYDKQKYQDLI